MANFNEINELRRTQEKLRKLTNDAYLELANVSESSDASFSLNGLNVIAERALGRVMRLVNPVVSEIKELEIKFVAQPNVELAQRLFDKSHTLLQKKMNADAVRILTSLVKKRFAKASVLLGTIFMNGLKDRIGKVEFKHPQNAMKCLTIGVVCGNIEAGYLLGTLFRTFGQFDKAKEAFQQNMKKGCVKSATEIIILLQIEAANAPDAKTRAIIEHKIKNLRVDLNYS